MYFLGIDVGTTGTKCLLISETGQILSSAYQGYPIYSPGVGMNEQNAEDWWNAIVTTVRSCCADPADAAKVGAISLSTQGGTIVPTDAEFRPLGNAIVWSDARCKGDRAAFDEALGKGYIYRCSGWNLGTGLPAMELRHMRLNQPELFNSAAYFLSVPDFVTARMTGKPFIDFSNAGINHLVDIRKGDYDDAILNFVGIRRDQLPTLAPSCTSVGTLTKDAAAQLGLPESTQVVTGAHDQYAVALGAGICEAGDAVIGTGTAWVVTALRDTPDFESGFAQSIPATYGKWGTMISISTGGVCLDWFRKKVAGSESDPLDYALLNELASSCPMGSDGARFFPYFNGAPIPVSAPRAKAAFTGLDLSHTRAHMARAVMEGVACQIVWALETLEKHQGIRRLYVAGGATKSKEWMRILASVAARDLHISSVSDLACVGAAMMAGTGCGVYADTTAAAGCITANGSVFHPSDEDLTAGAQLYASYKEEAMALRQFYGN